MAAAIPAVAGAVVGGLMNKKGSSSTQQVQASSDPWVGAQPGLSHLYNSAVANTLNGPPQYYPGQTQAGWSPDTANGYNNVMATAAAPNPMLNNAIGNAANTAAGGYLNANPALAGLQQASNFNAAGMQGFNDLLSWGQGQGGAIQGQDALMGVGNGQWLGSTMGMDDLNAIGNGGLMGQTQGTSTLGGIAGGQNIGQTEGMDWLRGIAEGGMLNQNPYVDDMFNKAAGDVGRNYANNVMPGMASMFAGAGRYGSEAMNNTLDQGQRAYGDQMSNLATSIYGQNYANERGQQMQALGQLGTMSQNERAQQLQALGLYSNIGLQESSQRIGAAQSAGQLSQNERGMQLRGMESAGSLDAQRRAQQIGALQSTQQNQLAGQGLRNQALGSLSQQFMNERNNMMQASSMAPALDQQRYYAGQQMFGMGQQLDAQTQRAIDADKARWDYNQNAGRDDLSWLNSIMTGAAPYASRTSSQSGNQGGNPMSGALGGMMMGQAIGSMMPQQQQMPPNMMNYGSGFGTGNMYGNQDMGLFL